jgi:hypothetical protein
MALTLNLKTMYDTKKFNVFVYLPGGDMIWCILQANNKFQAIDQAYTKHQDKQPNRKHYKTKLR